MAPNLWFLFVALFVATALTQISARRPTNSGAEVQVSLYFESLCPGCRAFIQDQLGPTYEKVGQIMDIQLIPYGNAQESQNPDGSWKFSCQHGDRECVGNLVDTCALRLIPDVRKSFEFIVCLENSGSPDTNGPQCAQSQGLDYNPIEACVKSPQGNQWQHENAVKTNQLNPPHKYVPWILINGVHTEDIETRATTDLLNLVCSTYTGTPPAACK